MKRFNSAILRGFGAVVLTLGLLSLVERAEAQSPAQPVTYAIATKNINTGYPFTTVPQALGYFAEEGLDVSIVQGESSATAFQLMMSGKADIVAASPDVFIVQRTKTGLPIRSIYAASRQSSYHLGVLKDGPIKSVKDLVGKTVGVTDLGSGSAFYAKQRMSEAGLDPNSITLITVGAGVPAGDALQKGRVDALVNFTSGYANLTNAGFPIVFLEESPTQNMFYGFNLYAREDFIKAHPDVIAKIGRATSKAMVFLKERPEAAIPLFYELYPERKPKTDIEKGFKDALAISNAEMSETRVTELPVDFAWGSQDLKVWEFMQDTSFKNGLIVKKLPPEDFVYLDQEAEYANFDRAAVTAAAKAYKMPTE